MKNFKLLTAVAFLFISMNLMAQDAKYFYGPVNGVSLDDMLAIGEKVFKNKDVNVESFNYNKGVIESSYYSFNVLVSAYRARIEIKNSDKGVYISFTDLQLKNSSGRFEEAGMILGKKPNKLIAAIGKDFEKISKDTKATAEAKKAFYNNPHTHYLFFRKATDLAVDRWYENFMQEKEFTWMLEFRDIKKNETKQHPEYKYIVTAKYHTGSSLIGDGGLYIELFTNDDKNTMSEKGAKIEINGKCDSFKKMLGNYYIDFVQI